jgi:signal peptidase
MKMTENKGKSRRKGRTMKVLNRILMAILVVILAGLGFLYFMPGYNMYLVRSESMTPNIKMGDLIITGPMNGPVSKDIAPGTVVTYEYRGELVTHRVKAVNGEVIVTQGDAVEDPDPWQVTISDVRGIYLFKIPSVGYLTNFVQSKKGWFLTIIIPGTLLVLWLVKDIVKEAFKDDKLREDKITEHSGR